MVNTKIRLIILFAAEDEEALYSQQKQDRKLTGSDRELLIAKFRLKLKKVGKTTRPFRYDLNQITYDYTVKVKSFSHVQLFPTPWTAACQAPPSMGFSRQEYWSGVPLPLSLFESESSQIRRKWRKPLDH